MNKTKSKSCKSCGTNRGVVRTQRFLYITGIIMFGLAIYGLIRLIYDVKSLF